MTNRTKKGYLWVFEQQDKWSDIIVDKLEQFDKIESTHLDWLDKHATVSNLLAWKYPSFSRANSFNSKPAPDTVATLPPALSEDKEKEETTSPEGDKYLSVQINKAEEAVENNDQDELTNIHTPKSEADTEANINDHAIEAKESKAPEKESIENIPTQTLPPSPPSTKPSIDTDTQSVHSLSSIATNTVDYDEQDDAIQLVVSTRTFSDAAHIHKSPRRQPRKSLPKQTAQSPIKLPVASPPRPLAISPIQPFTLSRSTSTTQREQSSFMRRLFMEPSRSSSQKALSKEDSPSAPNIITNKRPSTHDIESEHFNGSIANTMQNDIEVSDFVPEPTFKRPKMIVRKSVSEATPKPEATKAIEVTAAVQGDNDRKEKEQGEAKAEGEVKEGKEGEEETQESFKIPSWATNPELLMNLKKQSKLDPDQIFGRMPPLQMHEIFPTQL